LCTVAFLPDASSGYLLGHNRDERVRRSRGLPPRRHRWGGRTILAPSDPDGGGTWIGVNDAGITVCLLNASHREPSRLPAVPQSRGLVAVGALRAGSIAHLRLWIEANALTLREMRAFHLVAAEAGSGGRRAKTARFRWDGIRGRWDLHTGPALFVSSGFDQAAAERARTAAWRRLLRSDPAPGREALALWFASHEPERGALSVCMHRPEARTVSRTIVLVGGDQAEMRYRDGQPCDPEARDHARRMTLS
jgi:hypothetical protein